MEQALNLLQQIITMAEEQDKIVKQYYLMTHKALKTVGDSSLVFHLNSLKELLSAHDCFGANVVLNGKELQVSLGQTDK